MICVEIDELTPCLNDVETGDIIETEVIRLRRKSFLKKFNKKNGWFISWEKLVDENEIYALVIKGTVDIQGLLAIRNDQEMKAAFISWMVAAPHNNKYSFGTKKYEGVGGHLFAIAAFKSDEYGYGCEMTGYAANRELEEHYIRHFDAIPIHMQHPYQILIESKSGRKIQEVYTYMNGRMMNYKKYRESLKNMVSIEVTERYQIDFKGLVEYARSKDMLPCDLSDEEKQRFIVR